MTLTEKIDLKKGIVTMDISDSNTLLTIDESGNFREYSLKDYSILNSLKTDISNSTWNRRVSFSNNGEYLVYGIPEEKEINVFSVETKETIYKIGDGYHQSEVTSTVTGNDNKYFISTSKDGRSFLWNIQTGSNIFSFPKHVKTVNISRFNQTNEIVAIGADDGNIQLFNISTMSPLQSIKADAPIRSLAFLSDKYLISLDKENRVILWKHSNGKKVKVMIEHGSVISKMTLSKDENFLFLSTIKGSVILYNLIEHKIVNHTYIVIKNPISNIVLTNKSDIIISDTKGSIYFYSAHNDQLILSKYIKAKKYEEAYQMIKKNDMLKFTKEAETLELIWHKILETSKSMLEGNLKDTIKVELLLEPFKIVPEKRVIIEAIMVDFREFTAFNRSIERENYFIAYDLVAKHESLEKTQAFKKLESIWQEHFRRAKSILFKKDGEALAKDILSKFAGISDKSYTIKNLFLQKNIYMKFQHLIKQERYNQVLNFVEDHQFLETNPDFQIVSKKIDKAYIQMRIYIRQLNFELAEQEAEFLLKIDTFREDAQNAIEEIEVHRKFARTLENRDMNEILTVVDKNPYLKLYPAVEVLQKKWSETVFKAQEQASQGDLDSIADTLKEFYSVKVFHRKMANIFKIAYLSDLNKTTSDNSEDISVVLTLLKRGVEKYIGMFGVDQEIIDLIANIEKNGGKINSSSFAVGNIEKWTPEKIQNSILQ